MDKKYFAGKFFLVAEGMMILVMAGSCVILNDDVMAMLLVGVCGFLFMVLMMWLSNYVVVDHNRIELKNLSTV